MKKLFRPKAIILGMNEVFATQKVVRIFHNKKPEYAYLNVVHAPFSLSFVISTIYNNGINPRKINGVTDGSGNARNKAIPDKVDNNQYFEDCDFWAIKPKTTFKNSQSPEKNVSGK